ncbi:MAG: class I SAM-dependent methyltransferase [Flavobacteriaceae bacterium]|nr:class I SAM-dependent methyltransferase [Flavobacteriaceae bacterium]
MNNKNMFLKVKDHSVSGEEFQLIYDEEFELLKTSPQPSLDTLPSYYKSDDYISHTDASRNLFEKAYHVIRQVALKRKLKLINTFSEDSKTLLDIGCGTGDFLQAALKNEWRVTGIEPNEKARKIANEKTNHQVFEVEHLNTLEAHSFDVITLWHVLEHLPKLQEHIELLKRLLKPNGRLIIAVPNYKSFDARYYKSFWAAYDVPRHIWHFSRTAISKLFNTVGMEIEQSKPLKFDAYYVSLLSEKYKNGWMNFFSAFFIGSRSNLKASRSGEYSSLIYIIKNS